MKRSLLIILGIGMSCSFFAQDLIHAKDGSVVEARVLEVDIHDIRYKKSEGPSAQVYSIAKSEVISIRYKNGMEDFFSSKTICEPNVTEAVVVEENGTKVENGYNTASIENPDSPNLSPDVAEQVPSKNKRLTREEKEDLFVNVVFASAAILSNVNRCRVRCPNLFTGALGLLGRCR